MDSKIFHRAKLTKCPEMIVGDMDSIKEQAKQFFEAVSTCDLRRMPDQNSTDLTKTLKVILEKASKSSDHKQTFADQSSVD